MTPIGPFQRVPHPGPPGPPGAWAQGTKLADAVAEGPAAAASVCPISLLSISLLRLLGSGFPGNSLWTQEFHPLRLRFCLSQTLRNPES